MKKIFALAAVIALSSAACGGTAAEDDSADDVRASATAPLSWVSVAQKASEKYVKNPQLKHIDGNIGRNDGFVWQFSFGGDDMTWATVQSDGKTATVIEHHLQEPLMGIMTLDLSKVKVSLAKLEKLASAHGLSGRLTHVDLSQPLTMSSHPHWIYDQGGKELFVDATTGAVIQ